MMNNRHNGQQVILQQAAAWYARLCGDDATPMDRHKWEHWLNQSDEHRNAWALVEDISGRFSHFHEPADKRKAYKALQAKGTPLISRRQALLSMAVLSLGGAMGWSRLQGYPAGDSIAALWADYSTGVGETREIALKDGSPIWLNTASALNATFTPEYRALHLLAGELLIETPARSASKTMVQTRHGNVFTQDASFGVRILDDSTCVTVYSGELYIMSQSTRCDVKAGQQLTFSAGHFTAPLPAPSSSRSWTTGIFLAEDIPLGQFVNELSRYRHGYLACSEQVATLRVIGTYSLKDTDRALTALAAALPVTIQRTLPWWVTVEARA